MLDEKSATRIINEFLDLEALAKQVQQRSYNARKLLEGFYPPAPQGKKKGLSDEQHAANKVKFKQQLRKKAAKNQ